MYWLLEENQRKIVRDVVRNLTQELSTISGNPQSDQIFPFVGRKDLRKAKAIIRHLSLENDIVCDPFSGSGIHVYAAEELNRRIHANEWEPYANRISSAPWRLPDMSILDTTEF